MKMEKSCGAVVFTQVNGKRLYVIIRSKEGIYGFPKGHMEAGETEIQTALREVREETGLCVTLLEGFRTEDSHPVIREGQPAFMKHIVYFLGQYHDQVPVAQETELAGISLMDYDTAMTCFRYKSSQRILRQAQDYLEGIV